MTLANRFKSIAARSRLHNPPVRARALCLCFGGAARRPSRQMMATAATAAFQFASASLLRWRDSEPLLPLAPFLPFHNPAALYLSHAVLRSDDAAGRAQ